MSYYTCGECGKTYHKHTNHDCPGSDADRIEQLEREVERLSQRLDSHARPRCGQWQIENGGFYLYDDRGQMLASISMQWDGYGWGAAQPHKTAMHGENDNVPDAQKAVLDALRPWCDVSAAEGDSA